MRFKNFLQKIVTKAMLTDTDIITEDDIRALLEYGARSDMPIMRIPVLNLILTLHLETRTDAIRDRIHSLYTWLPFLWFYGYDPRNRADDPNGDFEETAARITSAIRPLEDLRVLHRSIKRFVSYGFSFEHAIDEMEKLLDASSRDDTDYGPFHPTDFADHFIVEFFVVTLKEEF